MRIVVIIFVLVGLNCGAQTNKNPVEKTLSTKRFNCPDLGLYFTLPSGFQEISAEGLERLDKKGKKAIEEEFDNDQVLGWQPGCLNLQDSFKRTILIVHISAREAIAQDSSVARFIAKTFDQSNEFVVKRMWSKAGIEAKKEDAVRQNNINIGGYAVKKNALTIQNNNRPVFVARYYFFEKNKRLYMLAFTGNIKAGDNEAIEKALEAAKKL